MIYNLLSVPFIDYSIFKDNLNSVEISQKILINTINQYSFCIAEQDVLFKKSLLKSDILLPDGMAIVAAVRLLTGQKIKKIAGADIHLYLLEELNRKGGSCLYLGSSEGTLLKIKERLAIEFPHIRVHTFSPPFTLEFSATENKKMLEAVSVFKPDVLFVGMTAPKQEKWAHKHKEQLDAKIICTIGAVFDFYAGTVKRPSAFWINLKLEWFIRLIKEPRRLWKRYLYYGFIYVFLISKYKLLQAIMRK